MSSTANPTTLAIAGGVAGIVEAVAVQPLELIKVRFQLNTGANGGIIAAAKEIVAEGGAMRLYRGLLPELCGMFPTRSTMYTSQEVAKRYLTDGGAETVLVAGAAGFLAGIPEAVVVTPFQVVKVRLQAKEYLGMYANSFDCVTKVFRQEGLGAFTIGMGTTVLRNSIWNGVYFTAMFRLKQAYPLPPDSSRAASTAHSLATGFVGGVCATMCNAPFDVVKSRIQAQSAAAEARYTSTFQALFAIGRAEGLQALYKGFTPKALRMGSGAAVAITTFDAVCAFSSSSSSSDSDEQ